MQRFRNINATSLSDSQPLGTECAVIGKRKRPEEGMERDYSQGLPSNSIPWKKLSSVIS